MPTSTLTDVARRAGVSVPTASRVMRGVDSVDHLLKEKVLRAASELGYQPNRLARSLRERKTYILGYMSAGSTAHFHTVLAEGVHDAGLKHGYAVVTGMSNTTERQQNYAQIFAGFQVDGLIVVPTTPHNPEINRIGAQLPIVEVDRSSSEVNRHAVLLDNRRAMQLAVDHLVDLGHTQIALLHGTLSVSTEKERYEGFRDALSQRGLEPVPGLLVEDDFVEAGGKRAMNRLLDGPQPLTAVVTTTNEMLAGTTGAPDRYFGAALYRRYGRYPLDPSYHAPIDGHRSTCLRDGISGGRAAGRHDRGAFKSISYGNSLHATTNSPRFYRSSCIFRIRFALKDYLISLFLRIRAGFKSLLNKALLH